MRLASDGLSEAGDGIACLGAATGAFVEPHAPGGTHGLLGEPRELNFAFFITGRGVPRGRTLDRMDMRDVPPTLQVRRRLAAAGRRP